MPALPNIPNVLRADLLWIDGGDVSISTRQFYRYSGSAPDSVDATALAADIYGAASAMDANWSTQAHLSGVRVTDLSSGSGGQGEHAQDTPGTDTGTVLSGGTAALVNFVIARRYRGGKPRSYFPWGTGDKLSTPQTWTGAFVTQIDSSLATYFSAVIGLTEGSTTLTQHVNVSYYDGFTVVTNPVTGRARNVPKLRTVPLVDNIASFAASSRPASQRRRN